MAARAIVHEIARAALQGLDVVDVRPRECSSAISPSSASAGAEGNGKAGGKTAMRDRSQLLIMSRQTLSGTGFTRSNFVYQGISKKNAKYKIVHTLASIG